MNLRITGPLIGAAEPDEMRRLLEWGWVRLAPGHYQREVYKDPIMVFGGRSDKPRILRTT